MKRMLYCFVLSLAGISSIRAHGPTLVSPNVSPPPSDVQDVVLLTAARPIFVRMHLRIDGKPLRQAYDDFLEELFRLFDENNDGTLDVEEQEKLPAPDTLMSPSVPLITWHVSPKRKSILKVDEFVALFHREGAGPFCCLNDYQVDVVSYESSESKINASLLNKCLIRRLDRNNDGKVSRKELSLMARTLRACDFDDDEMITTDEAAGIFRVEDERGGQLLFLPTSMRSVNPFLVRVSTSRNAVSNMVSRLIDKYGRRESKKPIANLTRAELGLEASVFSLLDADIDNVLNLKELSRFAQRAPDVEINIELGDTPSARIVSGKVDSFAGARPSAVVFCGVTNLCFRVPTKSQLRQYASATQPMAADHANFKKSDADKNGYLDSLEAEQSVFYRSLFMVLDADRNGKIFYSEVMSYSRKSKRLQSLADKSWISLNVDEDERGFFGLIDTDHDDRLSAREMRAAAGLLKRLDRDGDRAISISEAPLRYELFLAPGSSIAYVYDGKNDEQKIEANASPKPTWFQKMDRNRDGDVSYREFIGRRSTFQRIDADGDCLLSAAEAKKADAALRNNR